MKVYYRKLADALRGPHRPFWLLTGDEPVQMREAARQVRARAKREGFDRRELRVVQRGFDWGELAVLSGPSLFGDRPMLDLRLLAGKPDAAAKAAIRDWCAAAPADSLVLLQTPRLDNRALGEAWAKAVDRIGAIVRIMPLDGRETRQWLRERLRRLELSMAEAEAEFFLSCVEGNLLAAEQELEKLAVLNGPGPVRLGQLRRLLGRDARYETLDLAQAMLEGRAGRIAAVARNLAREGIEPVAAHGLLLREARQALAFARGAPGLDRVFPFARREALQRVLARRDAAHFRALLRRFLALERVLKGQGGAHPWDALTDACLAFSGRAPMPPRLAAA